MNIDVNIVRYILIQLIIIIIIPKNIITHKKKTKKNVEYSSISKNSFLLVHVNITIK